MYEPGRWYKCRCAGGGRWCGYARFGLTPLAKTSASDRVEIAEVSAEDGPNTDAIHISNFEAAHATLAPEWDGLSPEGVKVILQLMAASGKPPWA